MNISQEDFEYMKEGVIRDMLTILVEERGKTMAQAFDIVYNSETLKKLESPATGLYFQSPRYVLSFLDTEH